MKKHQQLKVTLIQNSLKMMLLLTDQFCLLPFQLKALLLHPLIYQMQKLGLLAYLLIIMLAPTYVMNCAVTTYSIIS